MDSEVVKYVIDFNEADQELLEYAKKHINENPDTKLQILSEFRDFVYERGECSPTRMDDAFLLRFLRAREFIIPRAHRLLVNHFNFKDNNPDLFDFTSERLQHYLRLNIFTSMPFCDEGNRRICIFRPSAWDVDDVSAHELLKFFIFAIEVCTWEPRSQIAGAVGIFDLRDSSLRQALHITPSLCTKMMHLLVWSYPIRVHKIHIVNETAVFNTGITFVRPFLSAEIKNSIIFHGSNMNSLHEHISPKYLPERYGGIHPDYNDAKWLDVITSRKELLAELTKSGYGIEEELKNGAV